MNTGTKLMISAHIINILLRRGWFWCDEPLAYHEGRNYRLPIKTDPALLNTVAVNTVEDFPSADASPRLASPQFNFPHVADVVYHFLQDGGVGGVQGSVALVTGKSLCSGGAVGVEISSRRLSTACHFIFPSLCALE
jgi:hypothetical protein